ncbi:MAG: small-conductance mechanosensitive channel [Weeksellaceae bacterium]|nr:small-conductance mechanosensitive channel [Weeksellaceae bacterium]
MEKSRELLQSINAYFVEVLPKVLLGIGFLLISVLIYKVVIWLIKKLLNIAKINQLNSKINEIDFLDNSNFRIDISKLIIGFVKLILILLMLIIGSELLNLKIVSEQIGVLLAYLPQFLSGMLIFSFGLYLASQTKKLIYGMLKSLDSGGSKIISTLIFYLIFIFVTITAVNQIGIDTQIISTNISYIIGAALVTITISVGLGSKDVVYRLMLGYYTKKNLSVGMKIQIGELIGHIESIDNITLVLKTEKEKIMIPIKQINNSKVKIFSHPS